MWLLWLLPCLIIMFCVRVQLQVRNKYATLMAQMSLNLYTVRIQILWWNIFLNVQKHFVFWTLSGRTEVISVKGTAGVQTVILRTTWSGAQDQVSAVTKRRTLFFFFSVPYRTCHFGVDEYTVEFQRYWKIYSEVMPTFSRKLLPYFQTSLVVVLIFCIKPSVPKISKLQSSYYTSRKYNRSSFHFVKHWIYKRFNWAM